MLKEYFTISEILEFGLQGYTNRNRLIKFAESSNWLFRTTHGTTKPVKEYHLSNFPANIRTKIVEKLLEAQKANTKASRAVNKDTVTRAYKLAYARFELIDYIKTSGITKKEFIKKYNKKQLPLTTYDLIPEITRPTFYRWCETYKTQGVDGLRDKSSKRKLGKSKDESVKDLVIGVITETKHVKGLYQYRNY